MLSKSWYSQCLPCAAALVLSALTSLPSYAQLETVPTPGGSYKVPYPTVPTDVTGPGGSLGYSQDIRKHLLGPDRNTVPYNQGIIVARDCRYSFTGVWMPLTFAASHLAAAPMVNTLSAVIPAAANHVLPPSVFLPTADLDATITPPTAQIMQTANADYCLKGNGEVLLNGGALLIKVTNGCPLALVAPIGGQSVNVRLSAGAYALVSNFGGRVTVANLSDNAQRAFEISLNDADARVATLLRVGHMAEIYPTCTPPENELVAYTVLSKTPLPDGLTLETTRFSYPRALKRYNLTASIGDCDLRRILKTAAAISYVDREQEWLGMEQYAP